MLIIFGVWNYICIACSDIYMSSSRIALCIITGNIAVCLKCYLQYGESTRGITRVMPLFYILF